MIRSVLPFHGPIEAAVPGATPRAMTDPDGRLRELFDRHFDFVWRSLLRLGVASGAVDDATQEVFLVVMRKLDRIEPGRERSFLYGTALRVASDSRRARQRRGEIAGEISGAVLEALADPAPAPDEILERSEARRRLDAFLASLPLELRGVFVPFELEGLTMAEIADALGIPPGTVASRLRRARDAFHAFVSRQEAPRITRPAPGARIS